MWNSAIERVVGVDRLHDRSARITELNDVWLFAGGLEPEEHEVSGRTVKSVDV